jgi:hypothetical protein
MPISERNGKHSSIDIRLRDYLEPQEKIQNGDSPIKVMGRRCRLDEKQTREQLRFGNIAMLPFEKIELSSELNHHLQEAFLVETRSISGYSGSPVFVYRPVEEKMLAPRRPFEHASRFGEQHSKAITKLVGHLSLLGIDCGHVLRYKRIVNGALTPHPQGWKVESNTGMAIVKIRVLPIRIPDYFVA